MSSASLWRRCEALRSFLHRVSRTRYDEGHRRLVRMIQTASGAIQNGKSSVPLAGLNSAKIEIENLYDRLYEPRAVQNRFVVRQGFQVI